MGKASYMVDPARPSEEHMATDLDTRIKILGQLYANRQKFEKAQEIFEQNDVGIPYAFLVASGITIMMEESSSYIKDSWISVCNYLVVDPRGAYSDINNLLDASIISKKVREEESE
jgi:hypothetical protein